MSSLGRMRVLLQSCAHEDACLTRAPRRSTRARAPFVIDSAVRSDDAGAQLLLLRVTLDGELNEAVEERGIRPAAGLPHLRIHADRREAGDGVHFVHDDL